MVPGFKSPHVPDRPAMLDTPRIPFVAAFNAKVMPYGEIARTFVPSSKFAELAGHWNAVLVGPRGSGKTTLFKMLSVQGLAAWSGPEAKAFRDTIDYSGIYVPSDIAWSEMVNSLGEGLIKRRWFELMAEAAFVTNVLLATVGTMSARIARREAGKELAYRGVVLAGEAQVELVRSLCAQWRLQPRALSLHAVADALGLRLLDIKRNADLLSQEHEISLDRLEERMPYLGLPLVESVAQAVSSFDRIASVDGLWAILLDEFEVAPRNLQSAVLNSLRATGHQNLLLKVALAPCGPHTLIEMQTGSQPTQNNDFRPVELWYPNKGDADAFCEKVFRSRAPELPWIAGMSPEEVFGISALPIEDDGEAEAAGSVAYGKGPGWEAAFTRLAQRDVDFAHFLANREIDPAELDPSRNSPTGSTTRRVAPVVAFRDAYRGTESGKKRGRRPYLAPYSGWQAIAAMSEGNPRWLIAMLIGILSNVKERRKLPLATRLQTDQVLAVAYGFAETLRTVATNQLRDMKTNVPVFDTLEAIGQYFHDRLVKDPFVEDPPMSFDVEDSISEDVENCLRLAMNHGAIVCYEHGDTISGYGSLKGKRFRLSHLLAPVFKIPLRKSKSAKLGVILARPASGRPVAVRFAPPPVAAAAPEQPEQGSFEW